VGGVFEYEGEGDLSGQRGSRYVVVLALPLAGEVGTVRHEFKDRTREVSVADLDGPFQAFGGLEFVAEAYGHVLFGIRDKKRTQKIIFVVAFRLKAAVRLMISVRRHAGAPAVVHLRTFFVFAYRNIGHGLSFGSFGVLGFALVGEVYVTAADDAFDADSTPGAGRSSDDAAQFGEWGNDQGS
jgi:hypothetical protein